MGFRIRPNWLQQDIHSCKGEKKSGVNRLNPTQEGEKNIVRFKTHCVKPKPKVEFPLD